jgi:hypothetical protein
VVQSASVDLTGVMAQASVAQVVVPLSPLTATGSVGTVTQGLSIALSGVAAAGAVGSVGLGPRSFALTGNYAQGDVGVVIAVYWKLIDDMQVANWQNIGSGQTPGWSTIADTQTPGWALIDNAT